MALPLAWARRAPLVALAAVALALLVQAALGGFLVGDVGHDGPVLAVALYARGPVRADTLRTARVRPRWRSLAATRVAFDPAASGPRATRC